VRTGVRACSEHRGTRAGRRGPLCCQCDTAHATQGHRQSARTHHRFEHALRASRPSQILNIVASECCRVRWHSRMFARLDSRPHLIILGDTNARLHALVPRFVAAMWRFMVIGAASAPLPTRARAHTHAHARTHASANSPHNLWTNRQMAELPSSHFAQGLVVAIASFCRSALLGSARCCSARRRVHLAYFSVGEGHAMRCGRAGLGRQRTCSIQ
jgi:hypothetical protein